MVPLPLHAHAAECQDIEDEPKYFSSKRSLVTDVCDDDNVELPIGASWNNCWKNWTADREWAGFGERNVSTRPVFGSLRIAM